MDLQICVHGRAGRSHNRAIPWYELLLIEKNPFRLILTEIFIKLAVGISTYDVLNYHHSYFQVNLKNNILKA